MRVKCAHSKENEMRSKTFSTGTVRNKRRVRGYSPFSVIILNSARVVPRFLRRSGPVYFFFLFSYTLTPPPTVKPNCTDLRTLQACIVRAIIVFTSPRYGTDLYRYNGR